ncbi:MAG: hypothetical protein ACYC0J_10475 [Gammaproteobacteria bacterium]
MSKTRNENSIRTSKPQASKSARLMKDKSLPAAARGAAASSLVNAKRSSTSKKRK